MGRKIKRFFDILNNQSFQTSLSTMKRFNRYFEKKTQFCHKQKMGPDCLITYNKHHTKMYHGSIKVEGDEIEVKDSVHLGRMVIMGRDKDAEISRRIRSGRKLFTTIKSLPMEKLDKTHVPILSIASF